MDKLMLSDTITDNDITEETVSNDAVVADEVKIYVVPDVQVKTKPVYSALKRLFDIVASFVALILTLIPMLVISIMIKRDSPGPALFCQERLGRNGVPFMMYKFRTMRLDAEKDGAAWAERDDPRCTNFGKFLRKTRLDELPQLWNILRGDMSFVGPRPERQCFYDKFEEYIHGFSKRMAVKPGLTGHAQVNGGYDLSPEEKIVYDMDYIKRRSIPMDIECIIKTFEVVFTQKGAR